MLQRTIEYQPVPMSHEQAIAVEAAHGEGITLTGILRILRRRFAIIAATTAALVVLAGLVVIVVRPVYTATATILIDPRRPNTVNLEKSQTSIQSPQTDDAAIESQVLLSQSISVLRRVVDTLKLTEDPDFMPKPGLMASVNGMLSSQDSPVADPGEAKAMSAVAILQSRLKVVRQRNTFLVDINVNSHEPRKAAQIANAIANAYFEELIRSKSEATKTAAGWLNQQLTELKSRLQMSDRAVEDYRGQHNLTLTKGETVNSQQISDLNSKLVQARAEAAEARAKYDQVAQIAQSKADPGSLAEALVSDTIARMRGQFAQLRSSEAELEERRV